MSKVSVCIAVYNVEKYIEQCVRSLFGQTLDDLEYIFVDDASPDASIDVMLRVLEEYPHRRNQVKLIRHEHNQGVAATRKDAIAAATGEYIIHCDPDDWVELDMYEKLYKKAVENNADMVYCNIKSFGWSGDHVTNYPHLDAKEIIKAFFTGDVHGGLWNKLWKKEIAASAFDLPDDIFLCEDMRLNIQYLQKASVCVLENAALYCYRKSTSSISSHINNKVIACQVKNILFYEKLLEKENFRLELDKFKRDILMQSVIYGGMSASEWQGLWFSAKLGMITAPYSLKRKVLFYLACINYPLAQWIWSGSRKRQ